MTAILNEKLGTDSYFKENTIRSRYIKVMKERGIFLVKKSDDAISEIQEDEDTESQDIPVFDDQGNTTMPATEESIWPKRPLKSESETVSQESKCRKSTLKPEAVTETTEDQESEAEEDGQETSSKYKGGRFLSQEKLEDLNDFIEGLKEQVERAKQTRDHYAKRLQKESDENYNLKEQVKRLELVVRTRG